jgi:hypothetical protein
MPGDDPTNVLTEEREGTMNGRRRLFRLMGAIIGFALLIPATPASAAVTTLHSALSGGAAEVPDPGDPDGSGGAQVIINVKKEKLCFVIVVLDIALPTAAAHIHEGAAGVAGGIVVTLEAPEKIDGTGIGLATGCVRDLARPLLRDIKNDPDQYYINVHNAGFPGGAVRGQLELA